MPYLVERTLTSTPECSRMMQSSSPASAPASSLVLELALAPALASGDGSERPLILGTGSFFLNSLTEARDLYSKTFYGRNLRIFIISPSVCPWQAFPA